MSLVDFLAGTPPRPNPPGPTVWRIERAAMADCPPEGWIAVRWQFVREAEGSAAGVEAEILEPAPGEFAPHQLMRRAPQPGAPEAVFFVRADGRVVRVDENTLRVWLSPNASGASLLAVAANSGIARSWLLGLAGAMVRRAHNLTLAGAGDGWEETRFERALARIEAGVPSAFEIDGETAVERALWSAVRAYRAAFRGEDGTAVATKAAQVVATHAQGNGEVSEERNGPFHAEAKAQAALVRATIPLSAVLEAMTDREAR